MIHDTKNFKVSEFACKHCGENEIDQRIINMCQKIRDEIGIPVKVNSGYRCKFHNARVGGVKDSYHTHGLAADLSCSKGAERLYLTIQTLWVNGKLPELSWCKYYKKKNFVHIDIGDKRKNIFAVGD